MRFVTLGVKTWQSIRRSRNCPSRIPTTDFLKFVKRVLVCVKVFVGGNIAELGKGVKGDGFISL